MSSSRKPGRKPSRGRARPSGSTRRAPAPSASSARPARGSRPARPARPAPSARTTRPSRPAPAPPPAGIRLQKVLASAGVASRRAAEQMIAEGRVTVDGVVVGEQGRRVDPARARIEVDGRRISIHPDHRYYVLNKPAGVVTTARDPQGRRTALDLVRSDRRLFPVGRLDAETQGLLILTTHGDLAHRLMHPRFRVPRVYEAEVDGRVERDAVGRLMRGVRLDDGVARAVAVRVRGRARGRTHLEVTMAEGRKHEVRRMLEAIGHPVVRLARTSFGPLRLGTLRTGAVRELTAEEVGALLDATGL